MPLMWLTIYLNRFAMKYFVHSARPNRNIDSGTEQLFPARRFPTSGRHLYSHIFRKQSFYFLNTSVFHGSTLLYQVQHIVQQLVSVGLVLSLRSSPLEEFKTLYANSKKLNSDSHIVASS